MTKNDKSDKILSCKMLRSHAAELNKGEIAECALPPEPHQVLALGNLVGSDFAWSMKKTRPERKKTNTANT